MSRVMPFEHGDIVDGETGDVNNYSLTADVVALGATMLESEERVQHA